LANQYEFTITSSSFTNPLYPTQVVTTSVPYFRLAQMPNYTPAYATTYSVTVVVRSGVVGSYVFSAPSGTCNIFTPAVPATQVVFSQCGQTLPVITTTISGTAVPFANVYMFKVANINALGTEEEKEVSPSALFRLNMLTTIPVNYEQTYRIWIKAGAKVGTVYTWGEYGTPCDVTTPLTPSSTLVGDCEAGFAPLTLATPISSTSYAGATFYRFILQGFDPSTNLVYNQFVDRTSPSVSLSLFPATVSGLNYYLSVGLRFSGGELVLPRVACPIVIPNARMMLQPFQAVAYPNPFANNFMLAVTTSSQSVVTMKVYDMIGRMIEQREVRVSDIETTTIGDRYPSGVYNVVVAQDSDVQTVRVVKR
jgi:hypothetical protein